MSDLFISHAVADKALAKLLVDFLKEAIGVPNSAIFCSSVKGHHIPLGEDFNEYIKKQIQKPKLIVLLMTPAYLESSFCLMELGAAWAQNSRSLAIVVPPVDYDVVSKTLGLKQAWKITEKTGLVDFKEIVIETVPNLEARSEHTWDEKRSHWNVALKKVIRNLQQFSKIDASLHKEVQEEVKECEAEIERLEAEIEKLKERYVALEELKDKTEVKKFNKENAGAEALQKEFNELVEAVRSARPDRSPLSVFKHMILDHYGKAQKIDWHYDGPDFEQAIKYSLIDKDDGSVLWSRPKLSALERALAAVDEFLESDEGDTLRALQDSEVPMESDDLAFWEYHLSI